MGTSVTLISDVSASRAREDYTQLAAIIQRTLGLLISISIGTATFICLVAIYFTFALSPSFRFDVSDFVVVGLTIILLALTELDNIYSGVLKGLERFDISAQLEVIARLAWASSAILVCFWKPTAIALIASAIAVLIGKIIIKASLAQEIVGYIPIWPPRFERRRLIQLGRGGSWQVLQTLSAVIFLSLDRWIIGGTFGPSSLAKYNICLQLAQLCHTIPSAAFQFLIPWSSRNVACNDERSISSKIFPLALSVAMVSVVLSASVMLFGQQLLTLWISKSFGVENYHLAVILISSFAILAINIPSYFILLGFGQWKFGGVLNIIAVILYVVVLFFMNPDSLNQFAYVKITYGVVLFFSWYKLYTVTRLRTARHP